MRASDCTGVDSNVLIRHYTGAAEQLRSALLEGARLLKKIVRIENHREGDQRSSGICLCLADGSQLLVVECYRRDCSTNCGQYERHPAHEVRLPNSQGPTYHAVTGAWNPGAPASLDLV